MLINAGVRIGGGPHHSLGSASVHTVERNRWAQSGMLRNLPAGDANVVGVTNRTGRPDGYRHPSAWVMPQKAGTLGLHGNMGGTSTLVASGAEGVNISVTMTGTGDLSATGALVVSASITINGSSSVSVSGVGVASGSVLMEGAGSLSATLTGVGHMLVTMTGAGDLSAVPYATGSMEITISPFTELSPESLATNVWAALIDDNANPGSTGEALRLVKAILQNRTITAPAAGTFTVYDDDDVTVLISGNLWEDAAGTLPYDGNGAERRDRLS